jgi:uncharacterized linocin/CFP29 family protein
MDHLLRDLAPISEAGWNAVETTVRPRLTTYLAARKLVDFDGPHGWQHSATDLGRVEEIASPAEGLSALQRWVAPLIELRAAFTVSRRELEDVERGAQDADLPELDDAARRLAIGENVAIFQGYPAARMSGIAGRCTHEPLALPSEVQQYPTIVARSVDLMRNTGVGGPYGLAIAPAIYTEIVQTTEHGGYPLLDHLRQILDGPVVWAPGVNGGVVLSLRGGDFVFHSGEDISIGYVGHDGDSVWLCLEESFDFQVLEPDAAVCLRPGGNH